MGRKFIPQKVKKECVRLHQEGMTAREIYTTYFTKHHKNSNFNTFHRALRRWKDKKQADDKILDTGNLSYGFTPHATTVQIDRDGEIVQSWIKSKAEDSLFLELIDTIGNLPPLDFEIDTPKQADDYMLEIPLYDMHFGIAFFEYYEPTLSEILGLIQKRNYKEINIIIGQDLFHNDDFRGRTASGREIEQVDITKAWEDARQFYYHIIKESLEHSKQTRVIYSKGNHDESLTWAFVQMLKAQFDNIKVCDEVKERKVITFGDNFIGITHGEKGRAKSNNLKNIFAIEYPQEFAGAKVREIHAGHLHRESINDEFGIAMRRLSSGNITDDWHKDRGYVGAHKRFMVFEWSKKKLASIHYV